MWAVIFCASSALWCAYCLIRCTWLARDAARVSESQGRRLPSVESELRATKSTLDELIEEVRKMAESRKMQRVRAANGHASSRDGTPDPYTNPDEWRSVMNAQLARAKSGV